jgi:energy-coupling factor transporter transmembrane protein EcfT
MNNDVFCAACKKENRMINQVGFVTRSMFAGLVILAGFVSQGFPNLGLCVVIFLLPVLARDQLLPLFLKHFLGFILPFWVFLFVIYSFFLPADGIVVPWYRFVFNHTGFLAAVQVGQQVAILTAMLIILFISSEPSDIVRELRQKQVPQFLCYIISAGFFLVPLLKRQTNTIRQAQKARGLAMDGNAMQRALAVFPLLAPLINSILANLDERAVALEGRGFLLAAHKTSIIAYQEPKWEVGVRLVIFCMVILLVVYAWLI